MKKIILSDNKQNQLVDEITDVLMQRHSFSNGVIRGGEIAEFCPHKQVNNFIMFRIYQDWTTHTKRLSHPYFDFSHPDVKDATRRFLNAVSKHIQVSQDDFKKLVRKAVYNNLKLILNPEETVVNFFFSSAQAIPVEIYRKHAPYFSDFDFVIQSIQRYLEKNEIKAVERSLFLEKFAKVLTLFEQKEGKNIAQYQRFLFRRLTGKEMEDVIGGAATAKAEVHAPVVETPVVDDETAKHLAEEAERRAVGERKLETNRKAEAERKAEIERQAEQEKKAAGERDNAAAERKAEEEKEAAENKVEAEKAEADRKVKAEAEEKEKAEAAQKEEAQAKAEREKKTVIRVNPAPRKEQDPLPPREEAKTSVPPWVDQSKLERKKMEEQPKPKPILKPEPEATLPPWVNQPTGKPQVEKLSKPELRPPTETAAPKEEVKPAAEVKPEESRSFTPPPVAPKPEAEAPKTISDLLKGESDTKPRSLNDMFANREKEGKSILEASQENSVAETSTPKIGDVPPLVTPPKAETHKPEPIPEDVPAYKEVPVVAEEKIVTPEVEVPTAPVSFERIETQSVVPDSLPELGDEDGSKTLAESFLERQEAKPVSVNDKIASKAIKAEQIPVHKQFQFVQRVFGGSSVKFKVVLDKINKTNSLEETEAVLNKYVFNDPNINRNDKVAKEFELLVKNRFDE